MARRLIAAADHDAAAAEAWRDRVDELIGGFRRLTRSLARDGRLAAGLTPPRAAESLWASNSVPVWQGLAIERGWGAARTSKTLRRAAAAVVLARPPRVGRDERASR